MDQKESNFWAGRLPAYIGGETNSPEWLAHPSGDAEAGLLQPRSISYPGDLLRYHQSRHHFIGGQKTKMPASINCCATSIIRIWSTSWPSFLDRIGHQYAIWTLVEDTGNHEETHNGSIIAKIILEFYKEQE